MKYKSKDSRIDIMKTSRKDKVRMRKFKNACWIMHEKGMATHERHNIFTDCVTQATKSRTSMTPEQKVKSNLKAQDIFVQKVVHDYPDWFKGKIL